MKLFGTVILFTLFFIVQPHPSLGTEISESSSSLYFSENPIKFDPPIIKKIDTYFLPVRELVRLFDGTIRRSNINLDYTITINNQKYNIKPNVPTYQLNNQKKTFPSSPIVYKTRLYVPMESFLKNLNFKLIKKNNHFYAYSSNASTIEQQTIPLDYTHTETKKITKMYLPISNITLPITPIIINGKKKTDITEFIRILGYKLETIDRYFLIKKNNTIYSFKNGSNQVKISDKNIIKTKKLNYTPTIKNGRFYIPLAPFLNDLGFDYLEQNNTIIILKKLNHIAINDHLNLTLNKNSKIKINQGHQLSDPNRIYWDLGTTKCPNKAIQTKMNSVKTITFGQKNTTCRMVFHLNNSFKTSISKISNQDIKFTFKKTTPKAETSTTITAMQPISPPIQKPGQIASKKIKYQQTLNGKTIIIDPGHGGADPGAVNKSNDYEKYYTLDISKRMKRELEKKEPRLFYFEQKIPIHLYINE